MPTNKKLTIGLFGFGTVGKGLYDVLNHTTTLDSTIKKICIRDSSKTRSIPSENFTTNPLELIEDSEINCIVELIDDPVAAFEIVKQALSNGKAVVSANKKMIADNFSALLALQERYQIPFLYEASCCASMPIIRNLEEYYDNDLLQAFRGIINGSTNFILSKMSEEGTSFSEALLQAQQLGFAETDPTLDTGGADAANKLSILLAHAYGTIIHPGNLIYNGITNISNIDSLVASQKSFRIKLVAQAQKLSGDKLSAFVLPQFVERSDELYHVSDVYNAVITESSFADKHFFKGKGAGAFPTASAVLSDISALRYDYRYEYKKIYRHENTTISHDYYLKVFLSFDDEEKINRGDLEFIEESHQEYGRSWVIATIHAGKLINSDWWKKEGVSLILLPDPLVEDIAYKRISKRSLELAGL